ncbi:tail sheath protein [Enterobacter ludwigii]|uniref:phage tail sheath subtilisin-like domain-containing protein n=1 Tax=Enterobacter ludwigii TaxID=299767 RepID=UPI0003D939DA|nr:phage tail sheath subtilisin-like domain-containing protein [Enterobacter ludwigii]AHE69776.1 tail sheath protein [Enterobacter ludwigii]
MSGEIDSNILTPLFWATIDNSQANSAQAVQRTLLIGQMLSAGSAAASIAVPCGSAQMAIELAGAGSMLAEMARVYMDNDTAGDVYLLPLADGANDAAATGSIAISAVPTANGVLSLYIAGTRVPVTLITTDTVEVIGTDIAAAINAMTSLPVTAESAVASGTATVTLTAKNKGDIGNTIDLRLNYQGTAGGEQTPAGLGIALTAMSGGAGTPDMTDGLASLKDKAFDFIVLPYSDTTSLDTLKLFMNDNTGRWSYQKQIYGHVFATGTGTYGQLTATGEARNNQHESLMGVYDSPSPAYLWSAAYTGAVAGSLRTDPGRPVQTLPVYSVLAPPVISRFDQPERNNLLHSGIASYTVQDDGTVQIENLITTYQKNAYGAPDNSYLEVETLFTLMYVTRDLKTLITSKFGRMKLVDDGTRFRAGAPMVTPKIIKGELLSRYTQLEFDGYVQDSNAFAAGLQVTKSKVNPNRVDVLWDGILVNQLRIVALINQFRLQPAA